MRDIQDKTDGTGDILSAAAFNTNLINELQDFVVSAGFTLDPEAGPDTDTAMFAKSIVNYSVGAQYFDESGAADAYVLTRSGSIEAMGSYFDGVTVLFKPTNSNTGASTITVDGIGVVDLVDSAGVALTGGELTAGSYAMAVYNSSSGDFELIDMAGGAGYALDSTVAHLAGAETFTGQKTFAADVTVDSSTEADVFLDSGDYTYESRIFFKVAGVNRGYIGYTNNATASSEVLHFNVGGVSNEVLSISGAGTLTLPETTETKIALTGASNPLISFSEGAVNKGYIRWMSDGYMRIRNLEDSSEIRVANTPIFSPDGSSLYEIWHEGTFAYEESTFTPVVAGTTISGVGTYSQQLGYYQKIGTWVHYRILIQWTAHTGTGNITITGLPYTANASGYVAASLLPQNLTYTGTTVGGLIEPSTSTIGIYNFSSAASPSGVTMDTSVALYIQGSYQTT